MKIRNGFVSNSSSSSFVLDKHRLSGYQLEKLRNHIIAGRDFNMECTHDEDAWECTEDDNTISFYTIMNNFDLEELINRLGAQDTIIVRAHS